MAEITHRISFGSSLTGTPFTVERLIPEIAPTRELEVCARAIRQITQASWRAKLVDKEIEEADIDAGLPSPLEQLNRISAPVRNGRYWVVRSDGFMGEPIGAEDNLSGFLRVEEYKPRNPFKKPYPNITDLESKSGYVRGNFEKQASALLYFSLAEFDADREVAAYELDGSDGIELYEEYGFTQTGNRPTQAVGNSKVVTVHLAAPSVGSVRDILRANNPWLDVSDML